MASWLSTTMITPFALSRRNSAPRFTGSVLESGSKKMFPSREIAVCAVQPHLDSGIGGKLRLSAG
jgi:hypothetical protein